MTRFGAVFVALVAIAAGAGVCLRDRSQRRDLQALTDAVAAAAHRQAAEDGARSAPVPIRLELPSSPAPLDDEAIERIADRVAHRVEARTAANEAAPDSPSVRTVEQEHALGSAKERLGQVLRTGSATRDDLTRLGQDLRAVGDAATRDDVVRSIVLAINKQELRLDDPHDLMLLL